MIFGRRGKGGKTDLELFADLTELSLKFMPIYETMVGHHVDLKSNFN